MKPRPGQASIHKAIARTRRGLAPLWAQGLLGAAVGSLATHMALSNPWAGGDLSASLIGSVGLSLIAELDRPRPRLGLVCAVAALLAAAGLVLSLPHSIMTFGSPQAQRDTFRTLVAPAILVVLTTYIVRAYAAERDNEEERRLGRVHFTARIVGRTSAGLSATIGVMMMGALAVVLLEKASASLAAVRNDALGAAGGLALILGLYTAGAVERRTRRGALREAPHDTRAPRAPAPPA